MQHSPSLTSLLPFLSLPVYLTEKKHCLSRQCSKTLQLAAILQALELCVSDFRLICYGFYSLLTLYPFPVKKSMKILLLGMIYYLEIILPFQSLFYSMKNIYYKTFHFLLTFYTFEFLYNTFSLL